MGKKPLSLNALIAHNIGIKIVSGELQPGDTLEGEIAASVQLDVSRTAYREALRILSAKGLVVSKTKTGTRVSETSRWHMLDPDVLSWIFQHEPAPDLITNLFELRRTVEPVVQGKARARNVYLPGKEPWYDFWTGTQAMGGTVITAKADLATIPLYVRAGSILPLGPVKPYADAPSSEPLEIRIYPGRDGAFELYDDAGDGQAYKQGQRTITPLTWLNASHKLEIGARQGRFDGMIVSQTFSIRCGIGQADAKSVTYVGKPMRVDLEGCVAAL